MPKATDGAEGGRGFAARGDVNAFFGLMLDNIADLVLAVSLLHLAYGFPATFAIRYMVPGTAIGVLFGDLVFTIMAVTLARKTGRKDITAMPLGLDTPSTFGMVFFVLGPAFELNATVCQLKKQPCTPGKLGSVRWL
jgi:AGZA family xanthine/uracil permease-like MFS transporter